MWQAFVVLLVIVVFGNENEEFRKAFRWLVFIIVMEEKTCETKEWGETGLTKGKKSEDRRVDEYRKENKKKELGQEKWLTNWLKNKKHFQNLFPLKEIEKENKIFYFHYGYMTTWLPVRCFLTALDLHNHKLYCKKK